MDGSCPIFFQRPVYKELGEGDAGDKRRCLCFIDVKRVSAVEGDQGSFLKGFIFIFRGPLLSSAVLPSSYPFRNARKPSRAISAH